MTCATEVARLRVAAIMEGTLAVETQTAAAKRLYDARAASYDDSWHPQFAQAFMDRLQLEPGAKVLDLACGTGLLTFLAAERVGPTGSVTGVDVSGGMLAQARRKLESGAAPVRHQRQKKKVEDEDLLLVNVDDDNNNADHDGGDAEKEQPQPDRWKHVRLFEHSVTDLDSLDALAAEKGSFDLITMASALVLLPDPEAAIRSWLPYLKPGGLLALDVPHPQNQLAGIVLERVGRRMGVAVPYHRTWVLDELSLPDLLSGAAGLQVLATELITQEGYGERYLPTDAREMEAQFAKMIGSESGRGFGRNRGPKWEEARRLFYEEWLLEAERSDVPHGVKEVDGVWLTTARKPPVAGSCRCGDVRYTVCTARPNDSSFCHCRTCQKMGGMGGNGFVAFNVKDVTWLEDSERVLRLAPAFSRKAVRAFCERCGAPVWMRYRTQPDGPLEGVVWLALSTVDEGLPEDFRIAMRIFLDEKPPWERVPDDGAERWRFQAGGERWVE
ncbi:putative protein-l-isoaspartate(d-aspartate) o-methyltransferase protein [Lasiodiplodia theobromae]|nr:putative protein-l-isoaspartate(d-aspartate) o-methyltransferase protein [Lasiodiplodia theobromae]